MEQAITTLVSNEQKSFQGNNGPWTLHIFTDSSGERFQTNKTNIANAALGLVNQLVQIVYEVTERNGWHNREIQSIVAAPAGATPTPVTPLPGKSGGGGRGGGRKGDFRSKEEMRRADAMKIAVELLPYVPEGTPKNYETLVALTTRIETHFASAAPVAAAAETAPSSGASGGDQGAAAGAAAAPPPQQEQIPAGAPGSDQLAPGDDIPF